MNKLQLAQALHLELGAGPTDPGTAPTSVSGQSGELLRYLSWIEKSWISIQEMDDWLWMRKSGTLSTVNGTREYTLTFGSSVAFSGLNGNSTTTVTVTTGTAHSVAVGDTIVVAGFLPGDFNGTFTVLTTPTSTTYTYLAPSVLTVPLSNGTITLVDYGRVRPHIAQYCDPYIHIYRTSTGVSDTTPCYFVPWELFGGYYDAPNMTQTGKPSRYSIKPDGKITFDLIPNATYSVVIPYERRPQNLVASTDIPEMPAKFHDLIVQRAAMRYGMSNESNRAAAAGSFEYREMMLQLKNEQLADPL